MLTRTFVCHEHEDLGEKGWRPEWMENADPYTGMAIPHDMLEHPARCRHGAIADELMAHGAIYWLRAETGWFGRGGGNPDIKANFASDYDTVFRPMWDGDWRHGSFYAPPRFRITDRELYARFLEIAHYGKRFLEREWPDSDPDDPDAYHPVERLTHEHCRKIAGWMYLGYRYTQRRYRHCDQYTLSCLFSDIAEDADEKLAHAELGDRYRVSISLKRMDFTSKLLEREDY